MLCCHYNLHILRWRGGVFPYDLDTVKIMTQISSIINILTNGTHTPNTQTIFIIVIIIQSK